jgi:hypothetical protein
MAIDSQNKRRSVIFAVSRACYPVADATVDSGDRAHVTGEYRGAFEAAASSTLMAMEGSVFRRLFGRIFGGVN